MRLHQSDGFFLVRVELITCPHPKLGVDLTLDGPLTWLGQQNQIKLCLQHPSSSLPVWKQNTRPPFWGLFQAVPLHSYYRQLLKVALQAKSAISQRGQSVHGHIPMGICKVDRRNASKLRIKSLSRFRCCDSNYCLLPFILHFHFVGRLRDALMVTNKQCFQKYMCLMHFFSHWEPSQHFKKMELEILHSETLGNHLV